MKLDTASGKHRIVRGTGRVGGHHLIPEIRQIGWDKITVAYPHHLVPHRHEGAFELCLIVNGEVEWATQDASYVLRAGDIFVTQPDELHWGRDSAMHPCTLYWLHLDQGNEEGWLGFPQADAVALRERLMAMPRQLRANSDVVALLFQRLLDEHRLTSLDPLDECLRQSSARAIMQQLIVELIRFSERTDTSPRDPVIPANVAHAISIIRDPHSGALTNRQIAASVGTTVADLNILFVNYVGMSLAQFSLRERMRVARLRLSRTQRTITEIANELGFCSSQHFATAFKRMTGTSPSSYRSATRLADRAGQLPLQLRARQDQAAMAGTEHV